VGVRILLLGDVHGNTSFALNAIDYARSHGCDRVFALGDFGAWEHMADGRTFFNDVNRRAALRGITVYWLDGNHDKTSLVLRSYEGMEDPEGFLICRPHLLYAPRGHEAPTR
jgi:predicted phosphodiesterase